MRFLRCLVLFFAGAVMVHAQTGLPYNPKLSDCQITAPGSVLKCAGLNTTAPTYQTLFVTGSAAETSGSTCNMFLSANRHAEGTCDTLFYGNESRGATNDRVFKFSALAGAKWYLMGNFPEFHLSNTGGPSNARSFVHYIDTAGTYHLDVTNDTGAGNVSAMACTNAGSCSFPNSNLGSSSSQSGVGTTTPGTWAGVSGASGSNLQVKGGASGAAAAARLIIATTSTDAVDGPEFHMSNTQAPAQSVNWRWRHPPTGGLSLDMNTADYSTSVPVLGCDQNANCQFKQGFGGSFHTPASSSETCFAGQFSDDANYHYVCTSVNTWKRVALSAF